MIGMNTEILKFKSPLTPSQKRYLFLLAILTIGFLIRFWLLDKRWINPDEGAHIMDGRLILDGLVPQVDYGSRQVIYAYIIGLILRVFGVSYISARFLPLVSTMGISLLVFFISRKLFDAKVALLASAIYTFLPLSVVESDIVKTEPLTTLLSCMGIYLVILGVWGEKRAPIHFFLSGIFFSLAYYVRESSLAIPVAILLFFAFTYWKRVWLLLKNYGIVLGGYICVCLIIFIYYARFMTISQIWGTPINPFRIILHSIQNIFSSFLPPAVAATHRLDFSGESKSWNLTVSYLNLTLSTHSFLLIGFIFSLFIWAYSLLTKRDDGDFKKLSLPFSLLYSWLFSLALFYAYWTLSRGFFIQYFEEFLPPLAIILAFVIIYSLSKLELEKNLGRNIAIITLSLFVVFALNREFPGFHIKGVMYLLATASAMAFFYFSPRFRLQRWLYALIFTGVISLFLLKPVYLGPYFIKVLPYLLLPILVCLVVFTASDSRLKRGFSFVVFSLLVSSFVLSFAISGRNMGVDFDNVWSPETVREASDYIKVNSRENDEIMSGAVIWELESNRKPFMNQTHPLGYESGMSEEELKDVEWHLSNHKPRFIVLDGYTERTYLRYVNKLQMVMDEKYQLKKVVKGSRYPVKIYELKDGCS